MEKMRKQGHIKNHYVPQFYLRNWYSAQKIQVYNNLVSHEKVPLFQEKETSQICFMNHLYTTDAERNDYDAFENWLNDKVESPYKRTQDKILLDQRLGYEDYQNISRFVLAQYFRVPKYYAVNFMRVVNGFDKTFEDIVLDLTKKLEKGIKHKIPIQASIEIESIGTIPIITKFEEKEGQNYLRTEALMGRNTWIFMIQRMADKNRDKIRQYKWQIIKALEGCEWFTSDNPVTLLNFRSKEDYDFEGVWKTKHTVVLMPISPKYLLFCEVGCRQSFINSIDMQNFFNKCIIENSFLQVYSTKPSNFIAQTRQRTVNTEEYKRIYNMLSNWHNKQADGENAFYKDGKS